MATRTPPTYFGSLSEFQAGSESVKSYIERVKIFFRANHIAVDDQPAILLSYVGQKTYELLRDLLAPIQPADCSLDTLVKTLEEHFEPKPNIIAERYKFHKRSQAQNESVTEYLAELRKLATTCEFGKATGVDSVSAAMSTALLNNTLRDRFVVGLRSENIQKALLSKKSLTLQDACETARNMEAAAQTTQSLQQQQEEGHGSDLHNVNRENPPKLPTKPCFRCGRTNHTAPNCRFLQATCNKCGKRGHIAPVCRSAVKGKRQRQTYTVSAEELSAQSLPEEEQYHVHILGPPRNRKSAPLQCKVVIEGKPVSMEIDTGAEISIMSEAVAKKTLTHPFQSDIDNIYKAKDSSGG